MLSEYDLQKFYLFAQFKQIFYQWKLIAVLDFLDEYAGKILP